MVIWGGVEDNYWRIPRSETIVPSETPIWVAGNYITGDIPGTVIGLIEAEYKIELTIGNPLDYSVPNETTWQEQFERGRENNLVEFWRAGRHSSVLENKISRLNKMRQNAIIEEINHKKGVDALAEQLIRLQVGQQDDARKALGDFDKRTIQLEQETRHNKERQDQAEGKLRRILEMASKQLFIRSFNGDVILNVRDPNLEVVISDEFNHWDVLRKADGGESVVVRGAPPSNPSRTVSVFTYRGKISISYPNKA